MEDKPVTALVLLPPLSLIQPESLPTKCSQELTSLTKQRESALRQLRGSLAVTSIASVSATFFLFVTFLAWLQPASFLISLIMTLVSAVLSYISILALRWHTGDVKEYRQIIISPQLQLGAANESRYFDMAKLTNEMSVDLNIKIENEMRKDPSERNLQELKRKRALLSGNIEEIKVWANSGLKPKTK
jgi:hypothetical protein